MGSYLVLIRGKPLTRRERLRRVVILSASFARNVAYFRAGQSPTGSEARVPSCSHSGFWSQVSSNFLDIAVLEWCKLLGDDRDKHFWRNVVADPAAFEANLLVNLRMKESDFADFAKKMRGTGISSSHISTPTRRWTFHGSTLRSAANSFYHWHIVTVEAAAGDLVGLS